jgi:hypothetical protein
MVNEPVRNAICQGEVALINVMFDGVKAFFFFFQLTILSYYDTTWYLSFSDNGTDSCATLQRVFFSAWLIYIIHPVFIVLSPIHSTMLVFSSDA